MAIGHLSVRTHNRGRGHTAAAALAYRAGERLRDRVGCVHDYRIRSRVQVVRNCGVSAPERWTGNQDLQQLADAIEVAEKRKDSRLVRDFEVALPCELSNDQQIQLAGKFSRFLSRRYDTVVAWAVHKPAKGKDQRNIHAHLIVPTRSLNDAGNAFGAKLRVLDNTRTSSAEIARVRNVWAGLANAALIQAGKKVRVNIGRNSKKGQRRYARPARVSKPGFRRRSRALLRDLRDLGQLLAVQTKGWVVDFRRSIGKYFTKANAGVRLPGKSPTIIEPSPQAQSKPTMDGVFDSFVRHKRAAAAYHRRRRKEGMKASPMRIDIRRAQDKLGGAIETPPARIAPGQSIDLSTKHGGLQTAVITLDETPDSALARTKQNATVLVRAQYEDRSVIEVKRLGNRMITVGKAGPIGYVVNGKFALNRNQVGRALIKCLRRSILPIDEFIRQLSAAIHNDGAKILHTAMPAESDTDISPGMAKIFRSFRVHSMQTPQESAVDSAAPSLSEILSEEHEGQDNAPSS